MTTTLIKEPKLAKSKDVDACALGIENHTRLEDHDRRIVVLEKCKTSSRSTATQGTTGTLQLVMILLSIAGAVYGGIAWLGKDIDVVASQHQSDTEAMKELSKERIEAFASTYMADRERTLARLSKLEVHNIKELDRVHKENEELRKRLDVLLHDTLQKGQ